ncbi:MAG TPA: hypothetical protein VNF47_04010 [Streptosporangiaceae bacterium]|nr:hypothetical protein [Streptosporangiaceae bacterium]
MKDLPSQGQATETGAWLAASSAPPGARTLAAIPVRDSSGDVESWFVPVAIGESLVGYVRVSQDGSSYSALGQGQPLAAWTDPAQVRQVAERAGFRVGGIPFLGYDGVPARLAWVVPLSGGGVAYVTGDAVWPSRPRERTT